MMVKFTGKGGKRGGDTTDNDLMDAFAENHDAFLDRYNDLEPDEKTEIVDTFNNISDAVGDAIVDSWAMFETCYGQCDEDDRCKICVELRKLFDIES